jgi:hypothetical protein
VSLRLIRVTPALAARVAAVRQATAAFGASGAHIERGALADEFLRTIDEQEAGALERPEGCSGARVLAFSRSGDNCAQ